MAALNRWFLAAAALFVMSSSGRAQISTPAKSRPELPSIPKDLPPWMKGVRADKRFYLRGSYNFDIYNLPTLAYDLNAVAVGHAMAYEDLVTGKSKGLETRTFERIDWVLKHPPRLMPDEANISPTFGRKYGYLEQVFDWAHLLHAQTVDVLASTRLTLDEKDREIERLYRFYAEQAPFVVTSLPLSMEWLDSQPYSGAFRQKYPKVNGLFWGYHWLQGAMYDLLWGQTLPQQKAAYEVIGGRYHAVELYRTDRDFMPMIADTSPRFALRYPEIANVFDNLHMLHDMVNDILASEWISETEKDAQIRRATWTVLATTHALEKPGEDKGDGLHDHRHAEGMPGMGMMKGSKPELMYMPSMGSWMNMTDCGHCSMVLPDGDEAWKAPTVSGEGWTMRVRCPLCARDMSAQLKGRVVLRIPTEDPRRPLVLTSDEQGNLKGDMPDAVFLEQEAGHAKCDSWSQAFTSMAAFRRFIEEHPRFAAAKPLDFTAWSAREGRKPDTYVKQPGPVENPYRSAHRH